MSARALGRVAIAAAVVPLAALTVAGCGSDGASTTAAADEPALQAMPVAEALQKMRAIPLMTTLDGKVPPGRPTLVASSVKVLEAPHAGGIARAFREVRLAGTRSPIHVHPYGGWTCIVKGQATLYVQGRKPVTHRTGGCVNMPALIPMVNSNEGSTPTILIDNFIEPPGVPEWRIVEKGLTRLGDEFGESDHSNMLHP